MNGINGIIGAFRGSTGGYKPLKNKPEPPERIKSSGKVSDYNNKMNQLTDQELARQFFPTLFVSSSSSSSSSSS